MLNPIEKEVSMELQLNNITKSYGKTVALSNFTKTFSQGIYALLGPNGSGKTTLMNIITTNLTPNSGEIYLDNALIKEMGGKYREKIGYMPQNPCMYQDFSVFDFMSYIASIKGMKKSNAKEQIDDLLCVVSLNDNVNNRIKTLSGGMKQRLALAAAMLGDPDILILDEPTVGLDPKQRIMVKNYISTFAIHKIVIIATHVVSDIEYVAKEILLLKKGEIVSSGTIDELVSQIDGLVQKKTINKDELESFRNCHRIISIAKEREELIVRFISEQGIDIGEVVKPTLEDYYFYIFGDEPEKN